MIQIDRLRLHLPGAMQHRAVSITRLVGDLLAKQHITQDVSLESLVIKPQQLTMNNSDNEIANLIVNQIVSGAGGQRS